MSARRAARRRGAFVPGGVIAVVLAACAGGELAREDAGLAGYVVTPSGDAARIGPTPGVDAGPGGDARPSVGDGGPSGGDATAGGAGGGGARPPVDTDASVVDPLDRDGDGVSPPEDCDDEDPRRSPNAVETPGDGFDSNCDAQDDLPCVRATDCPPAWYCDNDFLCRPGCRSTDCRPGLQCHSLDRICLPADLNLSCGRDADCPAGTYCRLYVAPGSEVFGSTCEPTVGPGRAGAACEADAECASDACFYGSTCLGLCRDDSDCAPGSACAWTRLNVGETENRFRVCLRQIQACDSPSDCGAGDVCTLLPRPDAPRGFTLACLPAPADAGPGGSGAPCADDSACRTGICLGDGTCFGPCADDAECPAGRRCYDAGIFFIDDGGTALVADDVLSGLPYCALDSGSDAPCDGQRRCPAGETCAPRRAAEGNRFETRCQTAEGPGGAGEPCDADAACQLGACTEGRCLGLCFADGDCAAGTACEVGTYVLDDRDTRDPYDDVRAELGFCR